MPLVSVIVPTRNSARTLAACLASVRAQAGVPVELIVVDNGSTDGTLDLARAVADRVEPFGPERSAQRNAGARLATGDVLAFVDSDMVLPPDAMASCAAAIAAGAAGAVMPEESFGVGFWAACKRVERACYEGVPWMEAARAFRRDAFERAGGYDETMDAGEDWDLSARVASFGPIARVAARVRHDEGRLTLWRAVSKKWAYGRRFRAYAERPAHAAARARQTGIRARYGLFARRADLLAAHPAAFAGMLLMKTAEFAAARLGLAWSRVV